MELNKRLEKRNRMIQAAKTLFAKYGFEKTTMQKIADKSCVGVATLFRYFPNKEELIVEVVKEVIEQQIPYFEQVMKSNKKGIEKIDDVLTGYIQYITDENIDSTKLLEAFELYIAFNYVEHDLIEEIVKAYGKFQQIINNIVKEGKMDGSIQLSLNTELIVSTILNMFGTSIKKYSLYNFLPDRLIPLPSKEELFQVKDILIVYLQQPIK